MIKQHRLVNDLLKDDIKDMHGLQVRSSTIRDHGRLTLTLSLSLPRCTVQLKTKAP